MSQHYAIIDADGVFTGRTYSDEDVPTKTSENWPGKWAEPSAYHKPIPDQPDDLHTWDDKLNGWVLSEVMFTTLKTATIERVKHFGRQRVYSEYGPHAQRRLGLSMESKDEKAQTECHALIEKVRTIVDATEATITDAATVLQVREAEDVFAPALEKI